MCIRDRSSSNISLRGPDLSVSYDAQGNYWGYDANNQTYIALEAGSGGGSRLTYLGNQDVSGSSSLEIQVLDPNNGDAQLSIETIPISVTEVNDPPTAGTVTVTTDEDNAVVITEAALLAGADDVDTDNAALSVENLMYVGTDGSLSAPTTVDGVKSWTFTPDQDFNGDIQLDYKISDKETPTDATVDTT